jgi:hypothetical protein
MRIPLGFRRLRRAQVVSPFSWPVPAELRRADQHTLRELIAEAQSKGFSRNGKRIGTEASIDTEASGNEQYILAPILPESTPGKSWICILFAYDPAKVGGKSSPVRRIPHRLDVATRTFEGLEELPRSTKDQLLHTLIWEFTTSVNTPPPKKGNADDA